MKNKIFCLIGPSSTGKDTIKKLSGYPYLVSYRTREKRPWEKEGIDGHFVTKEEFLNEDPNKWVAKTYYAGNYYGVKHEQLERLNETFLLYVIDWEGVEYFKKKRPDIDLVTIFIDSDIEKIKKRMVKQGRNKEEIKKRLERIHLDFEAKDKCDYVINNNGSIEDAINQLHSIVKKEL